jgi:predicted outer membrane repeat protein
MGGWQSRKLERSNRPRIESLEDRAVPANYAVSTVAELQSAIAAVNNSTGPNTIVLAQGSYDLTSEIQIKNSSNLTIRGRNANANVNTVVNQSLGRDIEIDGGSVTISDLTIQGGRNVSQGAGIEAINANVTLSRDSVSNNSAGQAGGGIYAQNSTLNIQNTSLLNNAVTVGPTANGGALAAVNSQVTITRSSIASNTAFVVNHDPQATIALSGAGIFAQGGNLTINSCGISNNTVFASASGPLASTRGGAVSTINTQVAVNGSSIAHSVLTVLGNNATSAQGGAFSTLGGSLTLTRCIIAATAPGGQNAFYHPGVNVLLLNTTFGGKKLPAHYVLNG